MTRYSLRAMTLLVALAINTSAAAQQPSGARTTPQGVVVDFEDADIRTVITALAEAADLNVVFADLPARRITLRLRQPVPVDSVRALVRTIAEANGIDVVEQGGLMRFATQRVAEPPEGALTATSQEPRLFVYRLRHANAMRLAATLQGIFGGSLPEPTGISRAPLSQRLRDQRIPPTILDTLARRPQGEREPQTPGVSTVSPVPRGEVQIIPDETTNALLVRASQADWDVIQQAVAALDLRPTQVLIEVLIAEVRRSNEYEVSVSGKATRKRDGNTAELRGVTSGDLLLRWMNGGRVDMNVALSLLATRGDVRILSRPILLAQNNQEARILIGAQRPFVQVFRSLPTDAGVRDQIVQYRDVGTSLTILPTINPDGYVNLQLTQEVSTATSETQFGAPVISTREASTNLFVRDGQTTVIGGLIDRQGEKTRTGIPLLIDLPVLGALFGTTRSNTSVSELFLFLTPYVVQSDEDVDRLREGVEQRLELLKPEIQKAPPITPAPEPEP